MSLPAFFWRYLRSYMPWGALCAVTLVVFAVSSAAMIALLPPLFGEVLQVSEDELPGPLASVAGAADSGDDGSEASSPSTGVDRAVESSSRFRERVYAWFGRIYEQAQDLLGVDEDNFLLKPALFAPVFFVFVFALRSLASFLSAYSFQRIGFGVTTDIRNDLYDFLLHQSIRFHSENPSGELMSRVINDVSKLQNAVSNRLLDLFMQSVMLVVALSALFLIHAQLAFVCLIATPLLIVPIIRFGRGMFKVSHRSQERMADLAALLIEGIRGNRVVKAFGMERFESERFRAATHQHLRVNLRAQILASSSSPIIETLAAVGAAALLVYAGGMIRAGELTSPLFMTFLTTLTMLYDPVRKLNKVNLIFQEALAAAHRVRDMLVQENEIRDEPSHPALDGVEQGISFESVDFAYDTKQVLRGFDLEVRAGEVVALVGPSGAGKSTVVNLLPRFFDPERGVVKIDGVDVRTLALADLRQLIGLVTQETTLFNDTVRNNIAYGRTELSLERVREAAAAAYADEFIMELEHGYETNIGESRPLALRGSASASRHCPRPAQERSDPHPRRGDLEPRHRV